ncbi:MAG: hypothetical protein ACJAZ2_001918 [Glaciecola sp.]
MPTGTQVSPLNFTLNNQKKRRSTNRYSGITPKLHVKQSKKEEEYQQALRKTLFVSLLM